MTDKEKAGLDLLRQPFAANHISKLPKPTKAQTEAVKADFKAGKRCQLCGAWHHPDVVHLDYVGHAALTDRLLDADPNWTWEPMACGPDGLPALDRNGGMWIRLTICGVTRIGYGSADGKSGGDAIKEIIGDALRNAGMRFGAALDLWHKGDLHGDDGADAAPDADQPDVAPPSTYLDHFDAINGAPDLDALQAAFVAAKADKSLTKQEADNLITAKDKRKAALTKPSVAPNFDAMEADIPFATRQAAEGLRV